MEQITKILEQVSQYIAWIKANIEKYSTQFNSIVKQIQELRNNAMQQSQKYIKREVAKLTKKLDDLYKQAQNWLSNQLESLENWVKEQFHKVNVQFKRQQAKKVASATEAATHVPVPTSTIDKLAETMPDMPITTPSIPKLEIPKPSL